MAQKILHMQQNALRKATAIDKQEALSSRFNAKLHEVTMNK